MSKDRVQRILKRFNSLKSSRANWEAHWRDVARFVMPEKDNVWDWKNASKGEEKHLQVYDSSAIHFNELLASAFHSMLTNPSTQWFDLKTRSKKINALGPVKEYLQEVVAIAHLLLNNSNFQTEVHEFYLSHQSWPTLSAPSCQGVGYWLHNTQPSSG